MVVPFDFAFRRVLGDWHRKILPNPTMSESPSTSYFTRSSRSGSFANKPSPAPATKRATFSDVSVNLCAILR